MKSVLDSAIITKERADGARSTPRFGRFNLAHRFVYYFAVFIIAFTAALGHNFLEKKTMCTYFADSRHYLESANIIASVMLDLGQGKNTLPRMLRTRERDYMLMDGPILPLLFGTFFTFVGHPPTSPDWKIIVVFQSFLHALSASVLCSLLHRITNRIRVSFACSVIWAVYPAAIIGTERLMTESLACLLIVSQLWTLSASEKKPWWSPLTGLISGAAWIIKVVLIPPVIATVAYAGLAKRLKPWIFALIVGLIILVITPWAVYTKTTLGRMQITTERSATHNAFIGWDLENDGWQATFPTKKEKLFLGGDPLSALIVQIQADPRGTLNLFLEKFSRYYGYPYNDFRHGCFGLNHLALIPIHQLYVILGVIGAFIYLCGGFRILSRDQRYLANLCFVFLFFQQSYFLFEANTRYGFTAFPLLVLFGGFGLHFLTASSLPVQKRFRQALPGLVIGGLFALFVLNSESLVKMGTPPEVQHHLSPGESIEKVFEFGSVKTPPALGPVMVLIDGDKGVEDAQVTVNGHVLDVRPLPLNYYDSKRYRQFNLMKEYSYHLNIGLEDLRQWRVVPVPAEFLNLKGANTIKITARELPAIVYGERDPDTRRLLSTETVCVNRLLYSPIDLEVRPYDPVLTARVKTRSYISKDEYKPGGSSGLFVADADGKQTRTPLDVGVRVHLALYRHDSEQERDPSAVPGMAFERPLKQNDFNWLLRVYNSDSIRVGKYVTNSAITASTIKIPNYPQATHMRVTITGQVRGWERSGNIGIVSTVGNPQGSQFLLARIPFSIPVSTAWKSFEIADVVPLDIMEGRLSSVSIGLYPGPWPEVAGYGTDPTNTNSLLKNLKIKVTPLSWLDVRGRKAVIY